MSVEGSEDPQTVSGAGQGEWHSPANAEEQSQPMPARKRGLARVQPLTMTEIGITLIDLQSEIYALRKEQRDEKAKRQQQIDRNEAMFKDLVDAYMGITTTVKELKTVVTSRIQQDITKIHEKLDK
ncbi:hypothetical protein GNI_117730, partial [Gregarina niphandrodes]